VEPPARISHLPDSRYRPPAHGTSTGRRHPLPPALTTLSAASVLVFLRASARPDPEDWICASSPAGASNITCDCFRPAAPPSIWVMIFVAIYESRPRMNG
jgi:hypothetical protein